MSTWSAFPSKALWTASIITQMPSMPPTASLVNRPSSSMLCFAPSPTIWSHCAPNAANLALANVAQKTINYLPNPVKKWAPHHTETGRRINPKCALSSCHSALGFTLLGLLIVAKEPDGGASITGGILGILVGLAFLIAACLHWKCCDQIRGRFQVE